jgi:hypothetical protein
LLLYRNGIDLFFVRGHSDQCLYFLFHDALSSFSFSLTRSREVGTGGRTKLDRAKILRDGPETDRTSLIVEDLA